MVLAAWSPSGVALVCSQECTLSTVSTQPDMGLYIARTVNSKEQAIVWGKGLCEYLGMFIGKLNIEKDPFI